MVRYLSRSLLAAPFSLLGPPNRALLFSGVTLFLEAVRCFPERRFELQKKKKEKKGKILSLSWFMPTVTQKCVIRGFSPLKRH